MSAKGEFQGQIIINDVLGSNGVSLHIIDGSACIRGTGFQLHRMRISLDPFDELLLLGIGAEKTKEPSTYRYEWLNSGGLSQGQGHPADGELSEFRQIQIAVLTLRFNADRIKVSIIGDASSENLHPWNFQIKFVIQKNQMYSFFSTWNQEIDRLFEAARLQ